MEKNPSWTLANILTEWLKKKKTQERKLWGVKIQKMYRGSMPPDPPRSLSRLRSFRKSVGIHPRSVLGTCSSTATQVGPSDALPSSFESHELCGLEATGSVSDCESISVSSQIDNTQTTTPPQTRGNFLKFSLFCLWKARKRRNHFPVFGESIIGFATQWPPNDSQIWPSLPCTQKQLPSIEVWFVRNLWRYTLDEWQRLHYRPTRLVRNFY